MNSFKHLIITRFMCDNFLKKDVTNVNPLSNKWKEMAFDVAKRHIIPTLENQNNQNFTLVFLVGSNCNDEDIQRIYNLSDKLDIDICYLQYFKEYIENIETDYLITSRLDYDDHVFKYCVNYIQNYFLEKEPEVCIIGLGEGISLVDGELECHLCYNFDWLVNEGCPAPMTTLILKRTAVWNYFDIYKLGFHTEVVKNLLAVQSYYLKNPTYNVYTLYHHKKGFDIDYIWLRHKHSATYLVDGTIHNTNIIVQLSEEELRNNFGYITGSKP